MTNKYNCLPPLVAFQKGFQETSFSIRTPIGLLGIIRLGLGFPGK